jgi:hypothetical protein
MGMAYTLCVTKPDLDQHADLCCLIFINISHIIAINNITNPKANINPFLHRYTFTEWANSLESDQLAHPCHLIRI